MNPDVAAEAGAPFHPTGQNIDAELHRLASPDDERNAWLRWGPYLSTRQWGTVREDYSADGDAWHYLPFEQAHLRTYRWGEDGMLGICDDRGLLCFGVALWNEQDPILKERFFGLSNPQGNHGEDVKEYWFYLDNIPSHAYMKVLYKYPQRAFPYQQLVQVNGERTRMEPEYELIDTGIFDENRYFDVLVEYAKVAPDDIVIRITATNRGPDAAPLHLLPHLWYRNTWSWGWDDRRPCIREVSAQGMMLASATHPILGQFWLACEGTPQLLFTENESNAQALWNQSNPGPYVKDGINRRVVHGEQDAVNPRGEGTKMAAHYQWTVAPGESKVVHLRLSNDGPTAPPESQIDIFAHRAREADDFYAPLETRCSADDKAVLRQSLAGLLWCKQFYNYDVRIWLEGDPAEPTPPAARLQGRNHNWETLNNSNILNMPDSWEYPWYAAWDLAFHCMTLALIDPHLAKEELVLLLREWYMHPNGQIPSYEWDFSSVNPPVQALAALHIYHIEKRVTGKKDISFLKRVFLKLLLNFTWWVNREDREGRNIFEGGFLGLDNIGVFNREAPLPTGGYLQQADGTAWMATYCLNMLAMAIELAAEEPVYEDLATKFFEHFMYIAGAINDIGGKGISLWDEQDGFFYDVIQFPDGATYPLRVRSLVGLLPMLAVTVIDGNVLQRLPAFTKRMDWFLTYRPDLARLVSLWYEPGENERRMLAVMHREQLTRVLSRVLDPAEFLSDHGIRSLSAYYRDHPFELDVNGQSYRVDYEPGPSETGLFGGNSNWRGPVWFPVNYLLIEALRTFHTYYGDDFTVEYPTGLGQKANLEQIADALSQRLISIYLPDSNGCRPVYGQDEAFQHDPLWCNNLLFYEYFNGDTAEGLGGSHQTGWTALIANLLTGLEGRAASHLEE